MKDKNLVAVYGSLRKKMGNHEYYLKESNFKGEFKSEPTYTLHSLGAYPGLKNKGNTSVVMEVYEVTDNVLRDLNRLEGYDADRPSTFYDRTNIETPWGSAYVYIYVNDLPQHSIVESGDWVKYKTETLKYQSLSNN